MAARTFTGTTTHAQREVPEGTGVVVTLHDDGVCEVAFQEPTGTWRRYGLSLELVEEK